MGRDIPNADTIFCHLYQCLFGFIRRKDFHREFGNGPIVVSNSAPVLCSQTDTLLLIHEPSVKNRENYLFGTETNQCFVFGTRKFELSYLATS